MYLFLHFICWAIVQFSAASLTSANGAESFYTAGVVEFRPTLMGLSSLDMLTEHLKAYLEIINSIEANETDIIVFPEGTLNNALQLTYVPADDERVIPCLQPEFVRTTHAHVSAPVILADFLVQLSCAARHTSKYLVINLIEKEDCIAADPRPCASSGLNVYNTNVVIDREGRVVSRYRKTHLYVEQKNSTLTPEYGIFDTDFGVRFGHFICFDMLFYTPAQEMVDKYAVKDFIFTSYFYSELPFLTAVQLQQAWAWGNNVNLLAAGASYPQTGTTGSGIYAGSKGQLVSIMAREGLRKLYIARVPKNGKDNTQQVARMTRVDGPVPTQSRNLIKLLRDPEIENFNSQLLNLSAEEGKGQPLSNNNTYVNISNHLCMNDFCCTFDISTKKRVELSTSPSLDYQYRIGVFNGRRTYEKSVWSDVQICALYTCINETIQSCGYLREGEQRKSITFESLRISGKFKKASKLLIMPNSLNDKLYPLDSDLVDWLKHNEEHYYEANIKLRRPVDDLLTFGIYANYYDKSVASTQADKTWIVLILGALAVILTTNSLFRE